MWWARFMVVVTVVACGGKTIGEDGSVGTDADSNRLIGSLSDPELGELCDWTASQFGGYGVRGECGAGLTSTQNNRDECIRTTRDLTNRPSCRATVGQYEGCVVAADGDVCAIFSEARCLPLFDCV